MKVKLAKDGAADAPTEAVYAAKALKMPLNVYLSTFVTILENIPSANLVCDINHSIKELLRLTSMETLSKRFYDGFLSYSKLTLVDAELTADALEVRKNFVDKTLKVFDKTWVAVNGKLIELYWALPILFVYDEENFELRLRNIEHHQTMQVPKLTSKVIINNPDYYVRYDSDMGNGSTTVVRLEHGYFSAYTTAFDFDANTIFVELEDRTIVQLKGVIDQYKSLYSRYVGIDLETGGLNNVCGEYVGARDNIIFQASVMVCNMNLERESLHEITVYHPYMCKIMEQEALDLHVRTGLIAKLDEMWQARPVSLDCDFALVHMKTPDFEYSDYIPIDDFDLDDVQKNGVVPDELRHELQAVAATTIEKFIVSIIGNFNYNRRLGVGKILFGSSVQYDYDFIKHQMPEVIPYLHYRLIDVSSVALTVNNICGKPKYRKHYAHTAMSDIVETHRELKHLMKFIK